MKLLAIDTATERCSVALYTGGDIAERAAAAPRAHAGQVLPFVDELLADAELTLSRLDGLAFGRGPGGFTGLRVAAAVVQGLALGADLPVAGISDLAAVAYGAFAAAGWRDVVACLDARMGEIYYGAFRCSDSLAESLMDETLAAPEALAWPVHEAEHWYGAGPGFKTYWPALPDGTRTRLAAVRDDPPHARAVAMLGAAEFAAGRGAAPESAVPVYLRDRVAEKPRP